MSKLTGKHVDKSKYYLYKKFNAQFIELKKERELKYWTTTAYKERGRD